MMNNPYYVTMVQLTLFDVNRLLNMSNSVMYSSTINLLTDITSINNINYSKAPTIYVNSQNNTIGANIDANNANIKLFYKLFLAKYQNVTMIEIENPNDIDWDSAIVSQLDIEDKQRFYKEVKWWYLKFIQLIEETQDRYLPLLNVFNNQATHLLDKVTRTITSAGQSRIDGQSSGSASNDGTSAFNDIPRETGSITAFSAVTYITEITRNASAQSNSQSNTQSGSSSNTVSEENDVKPVIERLKDIREQYVDIMDEWVKEFSKLFIYN